ncbi:MAG TPA: hypothetical protein VF598_07730 [Hymenobacter sp.]
MTRHEIEAQPAEEGWTKWSGLVGWADTTVERWAKKPDKIWVFGYNGPREVEALKVERWTYQQYKQVGNRFGPTTPCDLHNFIYTAGEYPSYEDYTRISLESKADLRNVYAETREELCRIVTKKLTAELKAHKKVEQQIRDKRKLFKVGPRL